MHGLALAQVAAAFFNGSRCRADDGGHTSSMSTNCVTLMFLA